MDIRFLDETEDMENTLKKEILSVLNKHSQSKRGWGWTIMEDKGAYIILIQEDTKDKDAEKRLITKYYNSLKDK